MHEFGFASKSKLLFSIAVMLMFLMVSEPGYAAKRDLVTTHKDANGWKLKVNDADYFVKGIVWGYTPIGENYSYNLWAHNDEYVKHVLDYECKLMQAAGINTIRSFGTIPPPLDYLHLSGIWHQHYHQSSDG